MSLKNGGKNCVHENRESMMQIRGSSDLYSKKYRCDGSLLYFLKFTSN
jgi:hypothetical protein